MRYEEKIISLLKTGQIVPVIGAGVSYATAALPGWEGLIQNGINYLEDRCYDSGKINDARLLLNFGKSKQINKNITLNSSGDKSLETKTPVPKQKK